MDGEQAEPGLRRLGQWGVSAAAWAPQGSGCSRKRRGQRAEPRRGSWCHPPAQLRPLGQHPGASFSEGDGDPRGAGLGVFLGSATTPRPYIYTHPLSCCALHRRSCELRQEPRPGPRWGTLSHPPVCRGSSPGSWPPEAQGPGPGGCGGQCPSWGLKPILCASWFRPRVPAQTPWWAGGYGGGPAPALPCACPGRAGSGHRVPVGVRSRQVLGRAFRFPSGWGRLCGNVSSCSVNSR